MSFTILLQDERNEKINNIEIEDDNLLKQWIPDIEDSSFYCLKYLDLYGDAVFNRLQMRDLIKEMHFISNKVQTEEFKQLCYKIVKLAKYCMNTPHTYMRFCGD